MNAWRAVHEQWAQARGRALAPDEAATLAAAANRAGEPLLALEVVDALEALATRPASHPEACRLLREKAAALIAAGAPEDAVMLLNGSSELEGDFDSTMLHGSALVELAARSGSTESKQEKLVRARDLFLSVREAVDLSRGVATVVLRGGESSKPIEARNLRLRLSAALEAGVASLLLGRTADAANLAREVIGLGNVLEADSPRGSGSQAVPGGKPGLTVDAGEEWRLCAAHAEAAMILGDLTSARASYDRAVRAGHSAIDHWQVAGIRRRCKQLAAAAGLEDEVVKSWFPEGAIGVFAGHLADAPGSPVVRFPEWTEAEAQARIGEWIDHHVIRVGFCSLACGSDILFAEEAIRRGVDLDVILPFPPALFVETSVRLGGERWISRFEDTLGRARSVSVVSEDAGDERDAAFEFANRIVAATSLLRARAYDLPVRALAVWNGVTGRGRAGTAAAVESWRRAGIPTWILHPTDPSRDGAFRPWMAESQPPFDRTETALPSGRRARLVSMLNVVFSGYERLRDPERPVFQRMILGPLSEVLVAHAASPTARYGFGGEYVFVFDSVRAAVTCAARLLRIARSLQETPVVPVSMRMCLHAGPVHTLVDPVLNQYAHEGEPMVRASALARRAAPARIIGTEAFASMAIVEGVREIECHYVGVVIDPSSGRRDRLFGVDLGTDAIDTTERVG